MANAPAITELDADSLAAAGIKPETLGTVGGASAPPAVDVDGLAAGGLTPETAKQYVVSGQNTTTTQPTPRAVGADQFGNVIFDTPEANKQFREGMNRGVEKAAEGSSYGTFPYISATGQWLVDQPKAWFGKTVPSFQEDLTAARNYTAETTKQEPGISAVLEGAGSILSPVTVATMGLVNPVETAALKAAPKVIAPLVRPTVQGVTNAGLAATSAVGHDVGSGDTENIGSDALHAAELGGAFGVALPATGQTGSWVGKQLMGQGIKDADLSLAQMALKRYGIPTDVGQISPAGKFIDSIPLSSGAATKTAIEDAWQRVFPQIIGENADHITPAVLRNAKVRIGKGFDDLADKVDIPLAKDTDLINNLRQIYTDSQSSPVLTDGQKKSIQSVVKMVDDAGTSNNGVISGKTYQALVKQDAVIDQLESAGDDNMARFGQRIRSALDAGWDRAATPEQAAQLQQLRTQYKAYKTIAPLSLKPATGGIIPDQTLRTAIARQYANAATAAPGDIPLLDLYRIGDKFVKPASSGGHGTGIFGWLGLGAGGAAVEHGLEWAMQHGSLQQLGAGAALLGTTAGLARTIGRLPRKAPQWPSLPATPDTVPLRDTLIPGVTAGASQIPASTNPATGLPEQSLRANQHVARKLIDGSFGDHAATQQWIDQNKSALRQEMGGQGIQRVNQLAALLRRAQGDQTAQNGLSFLANGTPSPELQTAIRSAGVNSPEDLLATVVQSPQLTNALRRPVPAAGMSDIAQRQLAALFAAQAQPPQAPQPAMPQPAAPQAAAA